MEPLVSLMEVRVVLHYVRYEGTPNEKFFSGEAKKLKEEISPREYLLWKEEYFLIMSAI